MAPLLNFPSNFARKLQQSEDIYVDEIEYKKPQALTYNPFEAIAHTQPPALTHTLPRALAHVQSPALPFNQPEPSAYYKSPNQYKYNELLGSSGMPRPKNTYKQTDLVLEVTPPEVGHLNRGTGIKQKPKSETKKGWTILN